LSTRIPAFFRALRKAVPVVVSIIVLVSAIVGILQFVGVTHIDLYSAPTATTTPTPPTPKLALIAENVFGTPSPLCDAKTEPLDLAWDIQVATHTCLPNDGGTDLAQRVTSNIGVLFLDAAAPLTTFAANHRMKATFAKLADHACAGLITRNSTANRYRLYAFYICSNGDWFILKTTATVSRQCAHQATTPQR
jgi:hypothetical protein